MTLTQAQQHLDAWLAADSAVAKKQSYSINNRQLTFADVTEIREQITYWQREVNRLQAVARGAKNGGIALANFRK